MATKKQQRRRYERARAHGRGADGQLEEGAPDAKPKGRREPGRPARAGRQAGVPRPPSITRALKRSAALAAVFYLVLSYTPLGNKQSPSANLVFAVWMFSMFLLVTMLTDRFAWRRYLKQQGKL
jgi:hypothetical protein